MKEGDRVNVLFQRTGHPLALEKSGYFPDQGHAFFSTRLDETRTLCEPIIVKAKLVLCLLSDGICVNTEQGIILSNMPGFAVKRNCFVLKRNGTVEYVMAGDTVMKWHENAPTWKFVYYDEARAASLAFLMIVKKKLIRLTRDPGSIIAKMVYNSHMDDCWHGVATNKNKKQKC